ncbi:enoyl-CoA hydratase-related protein [Hydrogenimonas cancrithermarum]|uniref:Hydrogenase maturation protein n=1 Tax=Hydrogenimonas cancrithermarum TaxID=2993563 RepID=A0ABN6WTS3_9BACT|nr:enoyl-CoA hydratase-related protein [Hydrogenimonas cancrithermarum]BDY12486.1 hydrogenase maturation protein [Hydrogenimonas cancrithermarum]
MKILLLCTTFNSLTQAVYTSLLERGDTVAVAFALDEAQMIEEIEAFGPDLLLCPFLKRYLPPAIYERYPTFVFHPGPRGDRGPNALEYALLHHEKRWGSVWLKANEHYDGGDIYSEAEFSVRPTYKASLYRREVVRSAVEMLEPLFEAVEKERCIPQILNPLHRAFTQADRKIDWKSDTTEKIVEKIYLSDSHPGVLDEILGVPCYLYGAHREEKLRGEPKALLAKRDGAICLGTIDGAVWVSHLKEPGRFKLPATYVLKSRLRGVREHRLPLIFDRSYETFYEIGVDRDDRVAYLYFNFHNGAMSSEQCIRLKYAVEYLKDTCDLLVLMGGEDFFSNGIHLNILEESQKQGEDGWSNINAMNNLIRSILFCDEIPTVASFGRNAGAGGVFLGLACDIVVAREGVVFNPHYKTLGLSGSEYHTYTLPRRVGKERAQSLLEEALPIGAAQAKTIGMVDELFPDAGYDERLQRFCKALIEEEDRYYDLLDAKRDRLEAEEDVIDACKEAELERMYPEFWESDSPFHMLRREFVYKLCPRRTPERLKYPKRIAHA